MVEEWQLWQPFVFLAHYLLLLNHQGSLPQTSVATKDDLMVKTRYQKSDNRHSSDPRLKKNCSKGKH